MKNIVIIISIIMSLCMSCSKNIKNTDTLPFETNLIKKIDHILLVPEKTDELLDLLLNKFELSSAWPFEDFGVFSSGGIKLGNVRLEVISFMNNYDFGIKGFAFEPALSIDKTISNLDNRNIKHYPPRHYKTYWTTLSMKDLKPRNPAFFCEYHFTNDSASTIYKYPGGKLDIESIQSINITAIDLEKVLADWRNFLLPVTETTQGVWHLGNGPSLKFIKGDKDQIESITIKVKSLEKVKIYLEKNNYLGKVLFDSVSTDPEKTCGITFNFTQIAR